MEIEKRQAEYITITAAPRLDPVKVFLEDLKPGAGQITVTCYGSAWTCYFGAMGDRNIKTFAISVDADYLAASMLSTIQRATKTEERYLIRIIKTVQAALQRVENA